jgi:hypothetical protein
VKGSRLLSLVFLWLAICLLISALGRAEDWQEAKGEHFIVYFTKEAEFAKRVLNKAEVYYRRIASELGYPRYSEFWLWDKRVRIYIYPDRQTFLKMTGQPDWSHGMASYNDKKIISYAWSQGFVESLLPHEMAHLIFRDFVGFKGEIPLWLDEGVAQWAEEYRRPQLQAEVKKTFRKSGFLALEELLKIDFRYLSPDNKKVYMRSSLTASGNQGVLFLSSDELVALYYLQAFSMVDFLIERYGSERPLVAVFARELIRLNKIKNNQSPRNNNQTMTNNQISITKPKTALKFDYWLLVIGYWDLIGDCILVIGDWVNWIYLGFRVYLSY